MTIEYGESLPEENWVSCSLCKDRLCSGNLKIGNMPFCSKHYKQLENHFKEKLKS